MALMPLSNGNFKQFVAGNEVCVVDFWGEWCGPCQVMAPVLESVSEAFTGAVAFGAVNVDQEPELSERSGVMSIPTMVIYVDGMEAGRLIGMRSETALVSIIDKFVD